MAKIKLTKEQVLELNNAEMQLDKTQLIKRITAIKLRAKGLSNVEIGEVLMKSDQTISDWGSKIFKTRLIIFIRVEL